MGSIITTERNFRFQHANNELISSSVDSLPSEVIMEILSRVPTLDLVKLRYVCKRWRNIIKDPLFRPLQCSRSMFESNDNQVLIAKQGSELYFMDLTDRGRTRSWETLTFVIHGISDISHYYIIGSCNGLLCLGSVHDCSVLIMNPFTCQYKLLPLPQLQPLSFTHSGHHPIGAWGFGFDHVTKLFKVISMMWNRDVEYSEVRVCDLKSDGSSNWRYIGKRRILFWNKNPACFVNGRLHWTHRISLGSLDIISFDLADEKFGLVPRPDCLHDRSDFNLTVVGGYLCIFPCQSHEASKFHIWVMREYGVKESWMKEVNITLLIPRSVTSRSYRRWCLNGSKLVRDSEVLLKCNVRPFKEATFLSSNTTDYHFTPLEIHRRPNQNGLIIHTASLNWL